MFRGAGSYLCELRLFLCGLGLPPGWKCNFFAALNVENLEAP